MSLSFSFAAVAFRRNEEIVAYSRIPGTFYANVEPEIVETRTGASSFAGGARSASIPGEMIITLNERPDWIESLLAGGAGRVERGLANAADFIQVRGSSVTHGRFPLTQMAAGGIEPGEYQIRAVDEREVRVVAITSKGTTIINNVSTENETLQIDYLNAVIGLPNVALSAGDVGLYRVRAGADIVLDTVRVPPVQRAQEFQVLAYSTSGERVDQIQEYEFPRVLVAASAVALNAGVVGRARINGTILAPVGGADVYTRRNINQRRA